LLLSEHFRQGDSSEWINKENFNPSTFRWQEGYGAFSYSRSHIKDVTEYIENQEEHHRKKSFLEEYKLFLEHFEIDYNEQYIFTPLQ